MSRLCHIVDGAGAIIGDEYDELSLVLALDGFLDAGNAAALACAHLVDQASGVPLGSTGGAGSVIASFDIDQLHDYRARRPPMSFVRDHYANYEPPRLVVRLMRDASGSPYLLMHGPEPDVRWEGFAQAFSDMCDILTVDRVVSLGSVPMAVPHTRPIAITHHANNPKLIDAPSPWSGELRIPSSAQAHLEVRLGEWGRDMLGYVAHIPHYLAQLDYPRASVALLEQVEIGARIAIDLVALREQAEAREDDVARYLAANEEVAEVVTALEQQYDAFERAEESGDSLLASDQPLPTGEELGSEFERFLQGLENPDDEDEGGKS